MVRRRLTQKERKEETRKLLLDSAVEIFAEFGFHGASVDKIAEHAGFSKGAVYANFNSKEELFLALLERQMNLHVENIHRVIDQQYSLSHFIEKMDEYFNLVREENRTWSMLNIEFLLYAMRKESVRNKWSNMIRQSVEQISKSIEILMKKENHEFTLSSEEIAWTILSLENGMAIFHYINEDSVPFDLYGKALKKLLLSPQKEN
ncbi:TetR/AcrR family transcriptional regulator [Thermaerobacillus caldiproteolyticus]|uniref:AcrR family transcriptional regulator n=1 Tax=Thermaerobacillus caldiproteolyticus TaxID=247480 RepID=A0A7W0C0S9_9BACL|nr:TetR/AcrR family transcriptional regulator [Anoxybacillus caldiproteolyticus]MBA2875799.1 AcrR family transcriptional regulator [Anoxybacillus caldiproteolyticus]